DRPLPVDGRYDLGDMAVEVAVGAFRDAPRPMDIEGDRVGHGGSGREAGGDELAEGVGPVADGVLVGGVHLAEGVRPALGQEDRIVTDPLVAPRRADQVAADGALDDLAVVVRPSEGEGGDETGAAVGFAGERLLDLAHGEGEIPAGTGPTRRIDPGGA